MYSPLIDHINKRVALDPTEMDLIRSFVHCQQLKKKAFFLQEGQICQTIAYVHKGCLRVYAIDDEGLENNVFFTVEDWWVVELKSFIEQSPARFFIDAIEPCELWQIYKTDFDRLLDQIPKLEKWFRILLQNALIASENRIHHKSTLKAEDRYLEFVKKYPTLESRIPQKHIALYLGISPEFLSTMKARRWKQQKP